MNEQKTITIKEANGFPEGTPIPRITGKVTHIFDRKTGEGDFGPYSSQSGVISDGEDKILFTVWNKPEIPNDYKGRVVIFRAGSSKKPTLKLKSDFKDSSKRTLDVTKSCIMLKEDEETDDIPMEFDKTGHGIEPNSGEPFVTKSQPKANVAPKKAISGVNEVKQRLMQMANFRALCDSAVDYLYGEGASDEMKKDVSSCFFIQGMREGLEKQLPSTKPISKSMDKEAAADMAQAMGDKEEF